MFILAQPVLSFFLCLTSPSGVEVVHVVLVACRLVRMVATGVVTDEPICPAIVAAGAVWILLLLETASLPSDGAQRKSLDELCLGVGE